MFQFHLEKMFGWEVAKVCGSLYISVETLKERKGELTAPSQLVLGWDQLFIEQQFGQKAGSKSYVST